MHAKKGERDIRRASNEAWVFLVIKFKPVRYIVALALLQGVAAGARAEGWFFFSPLAGELKLDYTGAWNQYADSRDSQKTEFNERLKLRQNGYILDPGIASFAVDLEPAFTQSEFSEDTGTRSADGQALNYGASLRAFQGTPGPFGLEAAARRNTGTYDGGLGSESDFDVESRSVSVNWKNRAFPTTLSYNETIVDQTFRSGLSTITSERSDIQRNLTLRGRSRKLDIFIERAEFEPQIGPPDRNTTTDTARLRHILRWGKGSSLNTNLSYTDRTGGNFPYERVSIGEQLGIKHTENLSTSSSYNFESVEQAAKTVQHRGDFRITHQLYNSLTTSANIQASTQETEQISQYDEYGGGVNMAYRKRVPWGGVLTAGLGGSYTVTDRESTNGLLAVIDESHLVNATTIGFLLNQRFIVQSSVIVADSVTGIPYAPGTDYLVVSASGDLTEIQIVAGGAIAAAAVITPITVLVSYDYQPLPSQELSDTAYNYNLGLDFGWIRLFHKESISNQDRISGAAADFLTDRRTTATGLELKWIGGRNTASLLAERRFESIGPRDTETYSVRETLSYAVARNASLTANASQDFTETEGQSTDLYTANLFMTWHPRYYLRVSPFLIAWIRSYEGTSADGGRRTENFVSTGLETDWRYGRITLNMRYNHDIRGGDSSDSTQDRVMLTLKRKF